MIRDIILTGILGVSLSGCLAPTDLAPVQAGVHAVATQFCALPIDARASIEQAYQWPLGSVSLACLLVH